MLDPTQRGAGIETRAGNFKLDLSPSWASREHLRGATTV